MSARLRFALVASLLALVLAVIRPSRGSEDWSPRCSRVPSTMGRYHGEDVPIMAAWKDLLETNDILLRTYTSEGAEPPITLCLVFSSRSRKVAHPPEVCYSGQGFAIEERDLRTVTTGDRTREVVALTVKRDGPPERVFAYYRSREAETSSFIVQQLRLMTDAFLGRPLAAAFVRVSTPAGKGATDADGRLERFLGELSPVLDGALR